MRLLVTLFISVALHAFFYEFRPVEISVPTLAISMQERKVDLQIITRVKKKEIAPLVAKEEPKSTPPPKPKKEIKKPVQKQPKPKPTPEKEKPKPNPKPPAPKKKVRDRQYVSEVKKTPRLVEQAEYLSNPPPEYPQQARRRRQEGTVTLLVSIDAQGVVTELQIEKSSGFSTLDRAAEKTVKKWRFAPALIGTRQVASKVIVPIRFKLNR